MLGSFCVKRYDTPVVYSRLCFGFIRCVVDSIVVVVVVVVVVLVVVVVVVAGTANGVLRPSFCLVCS